jgi:hypothetical protein
MNRIFGKIKSTFLELKNAYKKRKDIDKLIAWGLGVYIAINFLSTINNFLLKFPTGLFLVLLFNIALVFCLGIKTYYDLLAVKRALYERKSNKLIINAIHTINQSLFIGFNIYTLVCLMNTL